MDEAKAPERNETKTILIQIALFLTTILTTTIAGAQLCFGTFAFTLQDFANGLRFSFPLLLILSVHEFGHYFTALYHKIKVSLPYYIPLPVIGIFGTLGAIIRMRTRPASNLQQFDVGLAGPLAGFVVALFVLWYGFATLPPPEYVFQFHPDYKVFGLNYAQHVYKEEYIIKESNGSGALMFLLGDNLVFEFFKNVVADPNRIPHPNEIVHYPVLMAGFVALFFTALNLLPIGQLDGGHIIYGLFGGKRHGVVSAIVFTSLVFYSGLGVANVQTDRPEDLYGYILMTLIFNFLCLRAFRRSFLDTLMYAVVMFAAQFVLVAIFPTLNGSRLWILIALILGTFVGIGHVPAEIERPLDPKRIVLGWLSLAIFVVCFSPEPFLFLEIGAISQP
jgi:membrane-associated protease RseP (regulator of RpoE activity)